MTVAPTYDLFILHPDWNVELIGSHGVHPNEAGYQFKEAHYFPVLLSAVKKLLDS
ncbi:SGNH/GDSL hydrolase family protein [Paraburkholderia sp. Se-20369]|nr:SGNH/GDSL hydrolase family protein [Paraburkholderia sp. Se-20369]